MRRLLTAITTLATLAAPLAACGGGGNDSPEAVAKGLISAMTAGDGDAALKYLPTAAQIEAHLDCSGERPLAEGVDKARERMKKEAAGMKGAGVKVQLLAFDKEGSKTETLAAGDTFRDCTVKQPIEVHTSKLDLSIAKGDDKPERDGETWTFLKLGDGWYYIR